MKDNNPLIQVSMQIILYAGDARNDADTALNAAENGNFKEAVHYLKDAEKILHLHIRHKRISYKPRWQERIMSHAFSFLMHRIL